MINILWLKRTVIKKNSVKLCDDKPKKEEKMKIHDFKKDIYFIVGLKWKNSAINIVCTITSKAKINVF